MFDFFNVNEKLTEKLYQQNREFAIKNKTFSILQSLYKTSVLDLTPEGIAKEVTDIVCSGFNLEFSGLFLFEKQTDSLMPLSFSKSESLSKIINTAGLSFENTKITDVSKNDFLKKIAYEKTENITNNILDIWKDLIKSEYANKIKTESHIRDTVLFPLVIGEKVLGVLVFGLNIDYVTLKEFEKSSMQSIADVVTLLLDKAYLHKNLQASYEVEKKAKEETEKAYEVEKQANEELKQLDEAKTQFMAIANHHLRTPLTAINWYVDLILLEKYGKVPVKLKEIINRLKKSTAEEIKIVNDLLNVSQFQLGKEIIQAKQKINIENILKGITDDLAIEAQQKGIYLTIKKQGDIPAIPADESKLKVALENIVDNAVKYTEKGGVTITLKIENFKLKIIISDTGIGMTETESKNLFSKIFERGGEAQKLFAVGRGIGLYLSAKIIEAHRGKIWAESAGKNKGATFFIELPVV